MTTLREDPYSRNHTSSGQSQGSKSRSQSHVGHGAMTTLREDPYSRNHTSSGQSQGSKSRSQSHVGHGARSRDNYSSSQSQGYHAHHMSRSSHDDHSRKSSNDNHSRKSSSSHDNRSRKSLHDERSRKSTASDRKPASKHPLDVAAVNAASRHESPPKKGRSDQQPVRPTGDNLVSPMGSYASPIHGETPMFYRQAEGIQISPVQLSKTNEHPLQGTTPTRRSPRNQLQSTSGIASPYAAAPVAAPPNCKSPKKKHRQSKKNLKQPPPGSQPSGSHDNPIPLEHVKSPDGGKSKEE